MDISKIFLNQHVHNNIVSTCNQCDKLLMREKYFYTVFDIYCVLYTYSTPQFRPDAFEVLKCVGQPKVYSIITVRTSMEKAMAPHSSTFAWKIPWMEEPGRLQSMGPLESDTTEQLHFHFSLSCIGEGDDNPLQCSCLENLRDEQAWWAAAYGVAQSWTRLKQLSSSSSSRTSMDARE